MASDRQTVTHTYWDPSAPADCNGPKRMYQVLVQTPDADRPQVAITGNKTSSWQKQAPSTDDQQRWTGYAQCPEFTISLFTGYATGPLAYSIEVTKLGA